MKPTGKAASATGAGSAAAGAANGRVIWRPGALPEDADLFYGFSRFAIELNELDPADAHTLPPTDSRLGPSRGSGSPNEGLFFFINRVLGSCFFFRSFFSLVFRFLLFLASFLVCLYFLCFSFSFFFFSFSFLFFFSFFLFFPLFFLFLVFRFIYLYSVSFLFVFSICALYVRAFSYFVSLQTPSGSTPSRAW